MVVPDAGKDRFLRILLGSTGTVAGALTLRGFQNNYTPDDDSIYSSFTESTFVGYASIAVPTANWGSPAIVSHVAEIELDFVPEWDCSGGSGEDLYGWWLTDDATSIVLLAQRFDTVRNMIPGAVEKLDPFKVKLKSFA